MLPFRPPQVNEVSFQGVEERRDAVVGFLAPVAIPLEVVRCGGAVFGVEDEAVLRNTSRSGAPTVCFSDASSMARARGRCGGSGVELIVSILSEVGSLPNPPRQGPPVKTGGPDDYALVHAQRDTRTKREEMRCGLRKQHPGPVPARCGANGCTSQHAPSEPAHQS